MLLKRSQIGQIIIVVAAIFTIIMGIIAVIHFFPEVKTWLEQEGIISPKVKTSVPKIQQPSEECIFDYSKVSVTDLKPIKSSFYSNSTHMVCYILNNPCNKTNETFYLIGEWFVDNGEIPEKLPYENLLKFSDISPNHHWYNWVFLDSINNKTRFRIVIEHKKEKAIVEEINIAVNKSKEMEQFLQNEKDGLINWDDDMVKEFLNSKDKETCGLESTRILAENLFDSTKNFMRVPPRTADINKYDWEERTALESFNNKEGTSSEFAVVYAALLRVFGIPSRIKFNNINNESYFFTEAYLDDENWMIADVYNENSKFGECINLSSDSLEKDVKYNGICLPSLYSYVDFLDIKAINTRDTWFTISGNLRSKIDKSIDYYSLKINATFYDLEFNEIFSSWTYLLSTTALGNETVKEFSLNFFPEDKMNFKYVKIQMDEFFSS